MVKSVVARPLTWFANGELANSTAAAINRADATMASSRPQRLSRIRPAEATATATKATGSSNVPKNHMGGG